MDTEANHEFRLKQTNKPVIGALQSSATEFTNTVCNARYKRVVHSELELDDAVSRLRTTTAVLHTQRQRRWVVPEQLWQRSHRRTLRWACVGAVAILARV